MFQENLETKKLQKQCDSVINLLFLFLLRSVKSVSAFYVESLISLSS
jgi:hypothetical protein